MVKSKLKMIKLQSIEKNKANQGLFQRVLFMFYPIDAKLHSVGCTTA